MLQTEYNFSAVEWYYTVDRWRFYKSLAGNGKNTRIQPVGKGIRIENFYFGDAFSQFVEEPKRYAGKTLFIPPDPATELMKCRRYYREIEQTVSCSFYVGNLMFFATPIEEMRTNPSVTLKQPEQMNTIILDGSNANNVVLEEFEHEVYNANIYGTTIKTSSPTVAGDLKYRLYCRIALDAEIY